MTRFSLFFSRVLCLEILNELPRDSPDRQYYDHFYMDVYVFPNATDESILNMISSVGHADNVTRDISVEMPDYERCLSVREILNRIRKHKPNVKRTYTATPK